MGQSNSKKSYEVKNVVNKPTKRQSITPIVDQSNESHVKVNATVPEEKEAAPTIVAAAAATTHSPPPIDMNVVPKWINESQFVEILKENVPQFSKIQNFRIKPALGAGENYATLMLRVSIDVELTDKTIKPVSYMLKVPHDNSNMEQMLASHNFFTVENEAYINFIPKLEELYKAKGLGITIAPRAYQFKEGVKTEPKLASTVLMHDLGQDGYKNVNRMDCLNVEQTKMVLQKMAQYHAAGAHYQNEFGPLPDILVSGMFGADIEAAMAMMETMMKPTQTIFLNNLKNYKNCEKYHDKLVTYFAEVEQEFRATVKPDPNEFNVISHGDSWVNNFLFKFGSKGELSDMIFVDFQNPRYGHPAGDLLYFIMTSVHIDYKLKDFDYFIKYYHDQLVEHLQLLGYKKKIPKLRELQMGLYKYGTWAITAAYLVLPMVLVDPTNLATFENFLGSSDASKDFKNLMYTSERFKTYIEQILPWLDNRGLLDVCVPDQTQNTVETPIAAPRHIETIKAEVTKNESVESEAVKVNSAVPDWLTKNYFKDLLAAELNDFKEIQNYSIAKATEAGDNYSSNMLAVDIDYQTVTDQNSTASFMLKLKPDSLIAKTVLDLMRAFEKEMTMYNEVLPQLEQLYQQAGQPFRFAPKNYKFAGTTDSDYILLQNMRPAGYKNAARLQGLNKAETEQVLVKLAKLHAASAQLYVSKGSFADCLVKPLHNEETRAIYECEENKNNGKIFVEAIGTFEQSKVLSDKLAYFMDNSFDLTAKAEQFDETEFNCLNHGDCWTNNILFSYDAQGKITDTLLIDYQRSCFGSPALDLYYFLLSSPSFDIKIDKFEYFVRFYHTELQHNLELLQYPRQIPTLRDLHTSLLKNPVWATYTVSTVMSAVLLDPTDNEGIDTLVGNDEKSLEFKRKLFQNERYQKHAEALFPWLNHRGLLNFE